MAPYSIRVVGDPVLRQRAAEVTTIDGRLAKLADDMIATMYDAPGVGLAAPQVGVEKRLFVYDVGDGPHTLVNPEIVEGDDVSIEADELLARCFQHELDHLDGILLLERLDADTRKQALKTIRELRIGPSVLADAEPKGRGFSLR
jgi:peptide deformylase